MLKEIFTDSEITNEQIEMLSKVNFKNDIVIVCKPNNIIPIIEYKDGEFFVKNITPISIKQNTFNFVPNFKMSYPLYLKINFKSALKGIKISNANVDEIKSMLYNDSFPIFYNGKILKFNLQESNRQLLLSNNNLHGLTLRPETNIIKFDFTFRVTQEGISQIGDIYIINHTESFNTFPNL